MALPAPAGADTTAPAVTFDAVSDDLIGSTETGADVTWHADEDGTYSVRVGEAGCTTDIEIAGGDYVGAPAAHTTTVGASFLAEGDNTIRVCVTDATGNQGSTTTIVEKDTIAPTVSIAFLSDSLIGSADPGTDVTWHANEPGTYRVRASGVGFPDAQCLAGTEVAWGPYDEASA